MHEKTRNTLLKLTGIAVLTLLIIFTFSVGYYCGAEEYKHKCEEYKSAICKAYDKLGCDYLCAYIGNGSSVSITRSSRAVDLFDDGCPQFLGKVTYTQTRNGQSETVDAIVWN